MEDGKYVDGSLWYYAPNKAAPIVFTILFTISGVLHFYQSSHHKSWRITWIYSYSSLLFIAGYALRIVGAFHYDNIDIFIASLVLLYAAPPLYELGNYLVLSRCLYYIPHLSPLHPTRTLTFFLGLSVLVEVLTANGAAQSITGKTEAKQDIGKNLLKAALVLQLGVMAILLGVSGTFHRRAAKAGILTKNSGSADIKNVLITLYCSCGLITIRTIYRTVEYFFAAALHPPYTNTEDISPLIRYEWFFWVFEGMLMVVNSYMLNWRHPGKYLPKRNNIFLRPDGTERVGEEFKDKRPFLLVMFDPLDILGLVLRRDKKWWEDDSLPTPAEAEARKAEEQREGGVAAKESSSTRS
ncbi:hypothetical protein V490_05026 [Pseudogymnoascus sp. VKM F-3557]|nr:hypothetical protein V490_05026 [Pseudogymnoascus sp. VKM F-3557]